MATCLVIIGRVLLLSASAVERPCLPPDGMLENQRKNGGTHDATRSVGRTASNLSDLSTAGVRLSTTVRYSPDFSPQFPLAADSDTEVAFGFREGSGLTVADSSGDGLDATMVGGARLSDCPL